MIKVILFDVDGVIIKLREKYFSQKLIEDFGLNLDIVEIQKFFKNEFLLCETGKADLKEELGKVIKLWRYSGSVEELMKFWFEGEAELVLEMVNEIKRLRKKGIKCFVSTNNEKYRVEYLWTAVGLKNFMDGCYSSASVGYFKHDAEFWPEIYKDLSVFAKSEILFLDNQMKMLEKAKDFGFNVALYSSFNDWQEICSKYSL